MPRITCDSDINPFARMFALDNAGTAFVIDIAWGADCSMNDAVVEGITDGWMVVKKGKGRMHIALDSITTITIRTEAEDGQ